ncbi:lytic transglycosylase domain-containing protein [Mesorhizobium sp. KR9-304]|uniref:lytic transglycosylase domain-containing protein n=1 Tax=Mesorhizobium sp. KR9-304 TaxID=3156614 RepID=UPI0032B49E4A
MIRSRRTMRKNRFAIIAASLVLAPAAAANELNVASTAAIALSDRSDDRIPDRSLAHITKLKIGLEALSRGEVPAARGIRDSFPVTSLEYRILMWAIAIRGGRDVPGSEIAAASAMFRNWPGHISLRRNSERAFVREKPEPLAAIAAFRETAPETLEGIILVTRSHATLGQIEAARAVIAPLWRTETLELADELRILKEFGAIIPAADHRARMERMLYAERITAAERVAGLAGAEPLAKAWAAVIRGEKKATALLKAVPPEMRSAGYFFAEAKYLRRKKKFAEAAEVMLKAPTDRAALVDPDAWWLERRVLSRELVEQGDMKTAYRIAAAHAAESPVNAADAEFHAGWYAFRGLQDANAGAKHFARIAEFAESPISLARAYYWLGRTAVAGAPGDAESYFRKAAIHGTTFYGQLAAERIGNKGLNVDYPEPSAADRGMFERREVVHAIRRLQQCGEYRLADTLYRGLAADIINPREMALLVAMADKRGNHTLALRLGKIAAARGIDAGALSHPVGAIPASADISGAGKALAYAIARQESEFNVAAVSHAGARGLLQLLPGTAKAVAKKAGLAYSPDRLTSDAGYNATLGAAFLGEQLGHFDGSYVLTFAGYNAGPGRAREWIRRYGDPRGKDVETVVDWIEGIPFAETRSYVQRVMENYQVYKMRLSGSFDIEGDLVKGR